MTPHELRNTHPVFRVDKVAADWDGSTLTITTTCGTDKFSFVDVATVDGLNGTPPADTVTDQLVALIGFIAAVSYWKATVSPTFDVSNIQLAQRTAGVWDRFMVESFGEFSYRNRLDEATLGGALTTIVGTTAPVNVLTPRDGLPVVLFSGGKDSTAMVDALASIGQDFHQVLYNPSTTHLELASRTGAASTVIIKRTIDPTLLDLNEAGYLNGHTPFSAYLGAMSLLICHQLGGPAVYAANTRSDDQANISWDGRAINHQWTKSAAFEELAAAELEAIGAPRYVASFRPLYELQLLAATAQRDFRSCNRGVKDAAWCGECAKCAWVFLAVAALDGIDDAINLVGTNCAANPALQPVYAAMLGQGSERPFECTGSVEEVAAALARVRRQRDGLAAFEGLTTSEAPAMSDLLASWGAADHLDDTATAVSTLVHQKAIESHNG